MPSRTLPGTIGQAPHQPERRSETSKRLWAVEKYIPVDSTGPDSLSDKTLRRGQNALAIKGVRASHTRLCNVGNVEHAPLTMRPDVSRVNSGER